MHPFSILRDPQTHERLQRALDRYQDDTFRSMWFFGAPLVGHGTFWSSYDWWPDSHLDVKRVSPFLHFVSNHYAYRDWCAAMHADVDVEYCTMVYSYFKQHDDYDRIMDFDKSFFGYFDDQLEKAPLYFMRDAARYLLYLGLLLYMLKVRLGEGLVVTLTVVLNFAMFAPSLW